MTYTLGIDIGTFESKGVLVDGDTLQILDVLDADPWQQAEPAHCRQHGPRHVI